MKNKDIQRFRLLYRILDESSLEWLSDEVRAFRLASSFSEVPNEQVEIMRKLSKSEDQIKPQIFPHPTVQDMHTPSPKNYNDCIQYIIDRIDNLAGYLEGSVNLAEELGISRVQLNQDMNAPNDLLETALQLKNIEKFIREVGFA